MAVNLILVALGIWLIVGAFTYKGSYNRAFARRGPPENPPTLAGRILLFIAGSIALFSGVSRMLH
jgi:hypothetical protein